ncbi:SMP-30/gluconolactonase/LRE family protein [Allorhizocola rhizosphaerae]|uniref:SMP-30/gluconolactonase/LRE family protein n=1 Tax=Allorhizocola rhizosphaerae TaxID=1872709 RepID=UPI000E3BC5D4|nr:SMP-30/gluconolactonase/LRE family protein [Allorhizocola rhizosphaerae]
MSGAPLKVFYDGFLGNPRLDHPEGVSVHPRDGSVWCGGEQGQLYRIAPDGSSAEIVADTDGFLLGVTVSPSGDCVYAADIAHRAVFRYDIAAGALSTFAEGFRNPNSIACSGEWVYISDSYPPGVPGPSVYRFDTNGNGGVFVAEPSSFANGLALHGEWLYIAESFLPGVSRVHLSTLERELVVRLPGTVPDGLAFGPDGLLYIACYEPSQILRVGAGGAVEVVAHDPTAHDLCHPTNIAFAGTTIIAANLGRWHLTLVPTNGIV